MTDADLDARLLALSAADVAALAAIEVPSGFSDLHHHRPYGVVRRLAEEVRRLRGTWTATPPTEPGWYWLKSHAPEVVQVRRYGGGELAVRWAGSDGEVLLRHVRGGEWSGPLKPPE